MKKLLFSSCIALAVSGVQANLASAQTSAACCCQSNIVSVSSTDASRPTTSYQRFSYEPMPMSAMQPVPLVTSVVEPQPNFARMAPAVQSYRRYSYQPTQAVRSSGSNARKERWEYSKADPRKYR